MKTLQWVNDPHAALHIHHSKRSGTAEVGFLDRVEAAQSLLTIMDNDKNVASIVLSAASNYLCNDSSARRAFLEAIMKC
jgi:hypothetical protein